MAEKVLVGVYRATLSHSLAIAYGMTLVDPGRKRLTRSVCRVSSRRRTGTGRQGELFRIAVCCPVTSLVVFGLLPAEALG